MQQHDEESILIFTTPGMSQMTVLARLANTEEIAAMSALICSLADQAKQTDSREEMKLILHSQIAMLNSLAAFFMKRSIMGFDNVEVLETMPQVPGELANLSLRCQSEMRGCLKLLLELEGALERSGGRIKSAKRQRTNSIKTSEPITQKTDEQAQERAVEDSSVPVNSELGTLETYAGCRHA